MLLPALLAVQAALGIIEARAMARPPEPDASARKLSRLLADGDRVFFYFVDWKPIGYAEYYLGNRFHQLMTNLATLEPSLDFRKDQRVQSLEDHEEKMAALVRETVARGGRVLFDLAFLPPEGATVGGRARAFLARMTKECGGRRVQALGTLWLACGRE
jgi:hypothetical protein